MHFRGNAVGHCWKKGDENANFPTNRESCSDFSLSATLPAVSFDLAINGFFSNQDPMLTNWFPNWWTIETWILVMELSSLGWFLRSWPLKFFGKLYGSSVHVWSRYTSVCWYSVLWPADANMFQTVSTGWLEKSLLTWTIWKHWFILWMSVSKRYVDNRMSGWAPQVFLPAVLAFLTGKFIRMKNLGDFGKQCRSFREKKKWNQLPVCISMIFVQ